MRLGFLFLWVASTCLACSGGSRVAAPQEPPTRYLERLASQDDFALLEGEFGTVKYWAVPLGKDGVPPVDKPCMFQNTWLYAGHITFLQSFAELSWIDYASYTGLVMYRKSRVLWAGELQFLPGTTHPRTGKRGVLGFFIYADPAATEALTLDEIAEVDGRIKKCVPYARDLLVLVGMDEAQKAGFELQAGALRDLGVDVAGPLATPAVVAEGYSVGQAYGFLRLLPKGTRAPDTLAPHDILAIANAEDDLPPLAGLLTESVQDPAGALNQRLLEQHVPNARIADASDNEALKLFDGRVVHLTVRETDAFVSPAPLSFLETSPSK